MPYSLTYKQNIVDVDYDRIMFDTYDYLDKLIDFRFGDVFYGAFYKYGEKNKNDLGFKLANYIRYGTNEEKEIWLLRYGLDYEDFEGILENVISINENGIKIKNKNSFSLEQFSKIERFIIN